MNRLQPSAGFGIYNGLAPKQGPKSVAHTLDFVSNGLTFDEDLMTEELLKLVEFVQTIFIDNSLNAVAVSIMVKVTQQKITAPPQSQGYYPILFPDQVQYTASMPSAAAKIPVNFINVPMPCFNWKIV